MFFKTTENVVHYYDDKIVTQWKCVNYFFFLKRERERESVLVDHWPPSRGAPPAVNIMQLIFTITVSL